MADVDHPKTHVEDQDVDLPRKQPESPKREGIDPLTESDTMYPRENVKANAARFNAKEEKAALEARADDGQDESEAKVSETVADQKELDAQANTPNALLPEDEPKTDEEVAKDDGHVEKKTVKQAVNEDNQPIEDGDLEDKETGTQNTSPSNKTTDETMQDEVKKAEKKVSSPTPKAK